jgi:hypothetical protein
MGDVTVYAKTQEMFWDPKGAMMAGKPAPANRLLFFFAVHASPPVTALYLNETGLKLLGAAIDWSLK